MAPALEPARVEIRWVADDLYLHEIEALRSELSLSDASPVLRATVGDAPEPYRELLRGVRGRMTATRKWIEASLEREVMPGADVYLDAGELEASLRLCDESLHARDRSPKGGSPMFVAAWRHSDSR